MEITVTQTEVASAVSACEKAIVALRWVLGADSDKGLDQHLEELIEKCPPNVRGPASMAASMGYAFLEESASFHMEGVTKIGACLLALRDERSGGVLTLRIVADPEQEEGE